MKAVPAQQIPSGSIGLRFRKQGADDVVVVVNIERWIQTVACPIGWEQVRIANACCAFCIGGNADVSSRQAQDLFRVWDGTTLVPWTYDAQVCDNHTPINPSRIFRSPSDLPSVPIYGLTCSNFLRVLRPWQVHYTLPDSVVEAAVTACQGEYAHDSKYVSCLHSC